MSFNTNNSLKQYTTILQRHVDGYGNNTCEQIDNELKQVVDREILLEQIPHPNLGVSIIYHERNIIDGSINSIVLKEIDKKDSISKLNEMKIDYNTGKVTLHYSLEGKYLNISYWGIGHTLIHSSRVYTKLDEYGDVCQTLDELIDIIYRLGDTDHMVNILQDIENAKTSIINNVNYTDINERLTAIEQGIKDYLTDHMTISQSINEVNKDLETIRNISVDVDYRMGILENNYLNPNFITYSQVDEILGGLK